MGKTKRFEIEHNEPTDTTFLHAGSHIDFPKADKAGPDNKDVYESSIGKYAPGSASGQVASGSSYAGRPGIGGSSPKKGGSMKPMKAFEK